MSGTFSYFMELVNNAVGAFKHLSTVLSTPLSVLVNSYSGNSVLGQPLFDLFKLLLDAFPGIGSWSFSSVLFGSSTVVFILIIGIVRWVLDILP